MTPKTCPSALPPISGSWNLRSLGSGSQDKIILDQSSTKTHDDLLRKYRAQHSESQGNRQTVAKAGIRVMLPGVQEWQVTVEGQEGSSPRALEGAWRLALSGTQVSGGMMKYFWRFKLVAACCWSRRNKHPLCGLRPTHSPCFPLVLLF